MTRAYSSPEARAAVAKEFAEDTAAHRLTVRLDQGLFRHLHFGRPDRSASAYWFTLTTFPGALVVDGDMGTWVFRRERDMFGFFRSDHGGINPGYWAEKLTAMPEGGYAEISQDLVKALIWRTALQGLRYARSLGADWNDVREAIAEFKRLRARCEDSDPIGAMYEFTSDVPLIHRPTTHSITFPEPWDHTLHQYRHGYLWVLYAIVWGIRQYDEHRAAQAPAPAEAHV